MLTSYLMPKQHVLLCHIQPYFGHFAFVENMVVSPYHENSMSKLALHLYHIKQGFLLVRLDVLVLLELYSCARLEYHLNRSQSSHLLELQLIFHLASSDIILALNIILRVGYKYYGKSLIISI